MRRKTRYSRKLGRFETKFISEQPMNVSFHGTRFDSVISSQLVNHPIAQKIYSHSQVKRKEYQQRVILFFAFAPGTTTTDCSQKFMTKKWEKGYYIRRVKKYIYAYYHSFRKYLQMIYSYLCQLFLL